MDPVLVSVAGLGASVVKLLLHASGRDAAAGLVGDAQEGLGLLARLGGQVNDRNGAVAKRIGRAVAGRVRGMYQECRDRGVDAERLDGVATEVERLVDRVAADDSLILEAVRLPGGFAGLLHDLGKPIRAELFERSEPYFDELVDAVAVEYVKLAPWSPKFRIEALKYVMGALDRIEEGVDEIRVGVGKGLENDQVTHGELGAIRSELGGLRDSLESRSLGRSQPGQVLFGGRPNVAAGFRERAEQERLRGLVIDGSQSCSVLVGMAGCGKSQLASALAQECEEAGWGLVAWINASSAESVRSDLVELANRLGIDTSDRPTENQVIGRCLDHLKSPALGDRLVVFDNVEDFEDLAGVVPQGAGLRVVATARSREASSAWEAVEVGVLPRPDSIDLVQSITGSQDDKAADAVAERLGDLPLAVAQAAETARTERWTLAGYLVRLEAFSSDRVIRRIPDDSYTDDMSIALLMAADSALGRIKGSLRDTARRQLGALAVLAESGVPTHWLDPRADTGKSDRDADARDDAVDNARCALTALLNASAVQQTADGGVTMLHRLQAQVLRENWNEDERAEAFDTAADLLDRVNIDNLPRSNAEGRRRETLDLIDQLRTVAAQDYSHPLFEHEQIRIHLHYAFAHADDLGLSYEALTLCNAVNAVGSVVGADHPDTLIFRTDLASAYESAGRLDDAIPLFEAVVVDSERLLGADHPHALVSLNNLAGAYESAGSLDKAIPMYEEMLTEQTRALGPSHPDTLISRHNLAYAYQAAGRLSEAIPMYEEVLADRLRVLGPDHPHTLASRHNLAGVYQAMGGVDKAIPLFEAVLADQSRVLGPDHPHTLTSRNNLASAYQEAGRLGEAIPLLEGALADRSRILGPDHPDTLASRSNLVYAYLTAGHVGEAIPLYEQVLADSVRALGPDHPHTLTSRNNLAAAYRAAGRHYEAVTLFKDTLGVCEEVLSPGHPLTTRVRENLETLEREINPAPSSPLESSEE